MIHIETEILKECDKHEVSVRVKVKNISQNLASNVILKIKRDPVLRFDSVLKNKGIYQESFDVWKIGNLGALQEEWILINYRHTSPLNYLYSFLFTAKGTNTNEAQLIVEKEVNCIDNLTLYVNDEGVYYETNNYYIEPK